MAATDSEHSEEDNSDIEKAAESDCEDSEEDNSDTDEEVVDHLDEENPIVDGVLTYYHIPNWLAVSVFDKWYDDNTSDTLHGLKLMFFQAFGLPFPNTKTVKIEVKPCTRFEIAPIYIKAEITIRAQISVYYPKYVDLFYYGKYKPSKKFLLEHKNIQTCFSPPKIDSL